MIKKSYGIACCRLNMRTDELEILMVRKRNTFSFIEFVLGHYKNDDNRHILRLFDSMTSDEKIDVWSMDFGKMWYRIWLNNPEGPKIGTQYSATDRIDKYFICKNIFTNNFLPDGGERLTKLLSRSASLEESLWDIPKGRVSFAQEKPLNCAIREFAEETCINIDEYELFNDQIYSYCVQAGKIKYQNNYFIAILHTNSPYQNSHLLRIDYNNIDYISEVVGLRWMSLGQVRAVDTCGHIHKFVHTIFRNLRKKVKIRKLIAAEII